MPCARFLMLKAACTCCCVACTSFVSFQRDVKNTRIYAVKEDQQADMCRQHLALCLGIASTKVSHPGQIVSN